MMKFRLSTPEDIPALNALAEKRGINHPSVGGCFICEEDGEIRGFVNGGVVGLVETLVADSPQLSGRLFSMIEGSLMTALPDSQYYAMVRSQAVGDLLKSQGWEKVPLDLYMKVR